MKTDPIQEALLLPAEMQNLGGIHKLVWQPPPLRVDMELMRNLDARLMESCRDAVDAMVIAYKRSHESELATPGGPDQLLSYYSECKERLIPRYVLELKEGPIMWVLTERSLAEVAISLKNIPRGNVVSLLVLTRFSHGGITLYLSNILTHVSVLTVYGPSSLEAARTMQTVIKLLKPWEAKAGFFRTNWGAILVSGALQSIYLTLLFLNFVGELWVYSLGMLSLLGWVAMAFFMHGSFPSMTFLLGKEPNSTRLLYLKLFILLNLIFILGVLILFFCL